MSLLRFDSPDDTWSVTVWGKNITNEKIAAHKFPSSALWGYPVIGQYEPPLTYGVTLGYDF